jgi:2-desacetyl-2-hydroxyethyl bacteriochlorophyllide A dehydrogenase
MKAQAIVFPAPHQVEIQSYDLPELRADELLIRTEYSGISQGTEIWALTGQRRELTFPTVPGYQSVGIIEQTGADVTNFQTGQRVMFASSRLPESYPPTWMGAHVSHALVPATGERAPLIVPENCDPVAASVSALPAVSLRGINMLNVNIGDLVVVTGQGLIGQGSAQLAKLRGATVVVSDIGAKRLELSQRTGADVIVNVKEQDLAEVARSIKPAGADAVIETTGRSDQFAPCVQMLRPLGQLLLQAWYPQPISFDFHETHMKRPTIAVTCGFDSSETTQCMELMSRGKLQFRELVTHLLPITEAPGIYNKLLSNSPDVLGVVFDWSRQTRR